MPGLCVQYRKEDIMNFGECDILIDTIRSLHVFTASICLLGSIKLWVFQFGFGAFLE